MNSKIILSLAAFLLSANLLFSQEKQEKKVKIGISGTIQNDQYGISIPMWLTKNFVLVPMLDFKYAEKVGYDLTIGTSLRSYFKTDKLCPYAALNLALAINNPSSDNTIDSEKKVDKIIGLAFGSEYFITENLSAGVELEGTFTKSAKNSNRFGNPDGLNFNTATMISMTIYF